MGCSDADVPAPTEIPAVFAGTPPSAINPPESALPPPPSQPSHTSEAKDANGDKPKRTRRTKEQIAADEAAKKAGKDPLGADAMAYGSATPLEPADVALANDASQDAKPATIDPVLDEKAQHAVDVTVAKCVPAAVTRAVDAPVVEEGFTLYVDCIPIGKPAKAVARLIDKAQERIHKELGVADYRLVDFGKGVPPFIAFVDEQVDGTFDVVLDTRTPEGAILLETLSAKAAFVVRGLR
jgi:hypothetical protein